MNQVTDYTAGGLHPPVDWTVRHDAGEPGNPSADQVCAVYLTVEGGEFQLHGDPAEPFHCWDLPLEEWTEPETMG